VELRHHPLISYRGAHAWPPTWLWRDGETKKDVHGEIGILKEIIPSLITPIDRLFLIVEHERNEYLGCLVFTDRDFCQQILDLLQAHQGRTIEYIGGLDLSQLL
jgi:hypothetical protein